jgi:alkaline phosphatase
MRSLKEFAKLVSAALVVVAIVFVAAPFFGYRPSLRLATGKTLSSGQLDFEVAASPDLIDESSSEEPTVDNVLLLIADGTGFSHIQAARSHLVGPNRRLSFEKMPVTGWLTTHSVESIYMDSASAATALASGCKTHPGGLSVQTDGTPCRTIVEAASASGLRVGLITDSYFYDATVAAFAVHLPSRRDYQTIIGLMMEAELDILMGSTRSEIEPPESQKILRGFGERGFQTASSWQELQEIRKTDRTSHIATIFARETVADPATAPSLRQLLEFSLERFEISPGFFLVVETEDPDTGSHRGNLEQVIRGLGALHSAAQRAIEFAEANTRTLVLVTSDHETGGLSLLGGSHGEGLRYRWNTTRHTGSPVPLYAFGPGAERFAGVRDNTEVPHILADLLGLDL